MDYTPDIEQTERALAEADVKLAEIQQLLANWMTRKQQLIGALAAWREAQLRVTTPTEVTPAPITPEVVG